LAQFQDAAATAGFANSEFASEQEELQRTIDAASHAMTLIEMQGVGQPGGSSAGVDSSAAEADVTALLGDLDAGSQNTPQVRAQELMTKLKSMYTRLTQEKGSATVEHNGMLQKLWSFTDHLNSSIMEAQSQVTAITMEAAQRKREHARLSGRISGLSSLLAAVNASAQATEVTCIEEQQHRGDISSFISAESSAVSAIMNHLPAADAPQDGRPAVLLQVSSQSSESSGMLVRRALDDVEELARQFPDESQWYASALQHLATLHGASVKPAAVSVAAADVEGSGSDDGEDEADKDPLKSIRQFVKDDGSAQSGGNLAAQGGLGYSAKQLPNLDEVKTLFADLLSHVHAKSHAVSQEQGMCASVLQHAAVDDAALQRSLKRVNAKLHIAQAAMSEYQRSTDFDKSQRTLVAASLKELEAVMAEESKQSDGALEALRESAQRLVSLATDMIQAQSSNAAWVKDLLRKVEEHQAVLQRRSQRFASQSAAVEAADKALLTMIDEDLKQNHRHFVRARSEFQLLKGRAQAKADNQALSGRFQEAAVKLCSAKRLQQLKDKAAELQQEEEALQKNVPKAVQSEE